jgi:hypothetical protein
VVVVVAVAAVAVDGKNLVMTVGYLPGNNNKKYNI